MRGSVLKGQGGRRASCRVLTICNTLQTCGEIDFPIKRKPLRTCPKISFSGITPDFETDLGVTIEKNRRRSKRYVEDFSIEERPKETKIRM